MEYKKPKNAQDVIHDLKILHSNLNGHYQTELLTNAINFLESKEERKEAYDTLSFGSFKTHPRIIGYLDSGTANPAEFYFAKEQIEAFHNNRFESAKKAIEKLRDSEKSVPKKVTIDLSQPIKELKRYNKQLSKSIELQAEFKEKNEAIAKDLEEDVKTLESVLNESEAHLCENAKEGRTSCDMEEAHNAITCLTQHNIKIAKILQKHLSNGNV